MSCFTKRNVLTTFQSTSFLILCFVALFFMKEVFVKYQKNDTGMKQNEKPIKEHPTMTICFINDNITYNYGIDFNITYSNTLLQFSEEQNNYEIHEVKDLEGFVIRYHRVQTYDETMCFRLQKDSNLTIHMILVYVNVTFQESLKELPDIEVFFTSKANAEGIVFKEFMDGYELKKVFDKVHICMMFSGSMIEFL